MSLDQRSLRDALEQAQAAHRKLVELEQRGFDLDSVGLAAAAELEKLEARQTQLREDEEAATAAGEKATRALVKAMQGSGSDLSLSKRERWLLMLFDGGQLFGALLGFSAGAFVAGTGLPAPALAIAAPLVVLLSGRRRR